MNPKPVGHDFSMLDMHFARFIAGISGDESREIFLAAALVSRSTSEGNICLDLKPLAGLPVNGEEACPPYDRWLAILAENRAVGRPGDYRPLILDDKGRLYLYRYWDYEIRLADFIRERAKNIGGSDWLWGDIPLIREKLNLLFPYEPDGGHARQKLSALTALVKRFAVISGSPGTGKTTTVTKIMALLFELSTDKKISIALAAPTGKAAVRLQEAVKKNKESLPCSEASKAAIPERATTIHRLLGNVPNSPYFRYDNENPLPFDAVIVDEASMIDLPLLSKLVQALPQAAKLILLGDKDQLTSVEAGAVLGDICGNASPDIFSEEFIRKIEHVTGDVWEGKIQSGGNDLHECLVQLKKNYRFGEESGIGRLSAAVNAGDGAAAISLLKSGAGGFTDFCWREPAEESLLADLKNRVVEGYGDYLRAFSRCDVEEIFDLFESFRILCVLRHGPWGVEAINEMVERQLAEEGLIEPGRLWYGGRPVMITRNDYRQRLFNGDVGFIMADAEAGQELRAFFRDAPGTIRKFLPLRLPEHETVYAMTVHKSQGSEFDRVLLMLPDRDSPLLTRELIYTGLTRAKKSVEIWGKEEILCGALSRRIIRGSGLSDALWG